jgi:hypothetical protein
MCKRLRACAFTVNWPDQEQAIIPRAGLPDRPVRVHAPARPGCFMKQASVGLRVRRILRASSYYKSRADWNPIAAGKIPDWIPSRIIPRAPRAGALGRLLPALDSVCV